MSRTVTCAPADACSTSGSVLAGNGGASELPSSGRSAPPVPAPEADEEGDEDEDDDEESDAVPDPPSSPELHPATSTATSATADSDQARFTAHSVTGFDALPIRFRRAGPAGA